MATINSDSVERLRQYIDEWQEIRNLHPSQATSRASIWFDDVADLIRGTCGEDSEEYYSFATSHTIKGQRQSYPGEHPEAFVFRVKAEQIDAAARVVLNRMEKGRAPTPLPAPKPAATDPHMIFVSHGPPGSHLEKLKAFLMALRLTPIIVEEQPSQGRSVVSNVDKYASECAGSIVLATRDRLVDGNWEPNPGVLVEIGDLRERFNGKVIYMVQEGVHRSSMWSEHAYLGFTDTCMDEALIKLTRELAAAGMLSDNPQGE